MKDTMRVLRREKLREPGNLPLHRRRIQLFNILLLFMFFKMHQVYKK
jgi:hypothetical protein